MTTATSYTMTPNSTARPGYFARAEAWLDARGKFGWIAAMVLGFILFWPVGLALLAYMIWGKGLFRSTGCRSNAMSAPLRQTSGNAAFDAYRDETMRRLEEEQDKFESFLKRLRDAKDKAEFDAFMAERDRKTSSDLPQ